MARFPDCIVESVARRSDEHSFCDKGERIIEDNRVLQATPSDRTMFKLYEHEQLPDRFSDIPGQDSVMFQYKDLKNESDEIKPTQKVRSIR